MRKLSMKTGLRAPLQSETTIARGSALGQHILPQVQGACKSLETNSRNNRIQVERAVEPVQRSGPRRAERERAEPSRQRVDQIGRQDLAAKRERADTRGDNDVRP